MIFTIRYEDFRSKRALDQGTLYFKENEELIELFLELNGSPIILKTIYNKQGDEYDLIWKDDNLKNAIRLISIDKPNVNLRLSAE